MWLLTCLVNNCDLGNHLKKVKPRKNDKQTNKQKGWRPSRLGDIPYNLLSGKIIAEARSIIFFFCFLDPHIKVAGLPESVRQAKEKVMAVLDTKSSRVTLKMDVSHTDHSHIIGKGGGNIKRGRYQYNYEQWNILVYIIKSYMMHIQHRWLAISNHNRIVRHCPRIIRSVFKLLLN